MLVKLLGMYINYLIKILIYKIFYNIFLIQYFFFIRPIAPSWLVNATYALAGLYIIVDVGIETHKEHKRQLLKDINKINTISNNKDENITSLYNQNSVIRTAIKQTTFQSIASLALPAVIVHQGVHLAAVGKKITTPYLYFNSINNLNLCSPSTI